MDGNGNSKQLSYSVFSLNSEYILELFQWRRNSWFETMESGNIIEIPDTPEVGGNQRNDLHFSFVHSKLYNEDVLHLQSFSMFVRGSVPISGNQAFASAPGAEEKLYIY